MRRRLLPFALGSILIAAGYTVPANAQSAAGHMKPFSSTAKFKVQAPHNIVSLQGIPFTVWITSGSRSALVNKALVTMSVAMPGMAMPPNVVTFDETIPGCYKGIVVFTMPGKWKTIITATLPTKERAKLISTILVK